ncbi:MAG: hypothetical protein GKR87_09230 [Kiritimatiellae bacterium]|nr:hypothetical protein [Kiritimatiellia bacterium]
MIEGAKAHNHRLDHSVLRNYRVKSIRHTVILNGVKNGKPLAATAIAPRKRFV